MSGCNNGVMRDDEAAPRWNHNIHYHRIVLEAVPESARTALDIGTGNGLLAADLRERVPDVTAIDADESVLTDARADHDNINWVQGDVMRYDFGRSFDVVASVATLHHLPGLRAALRRVSGLVAPGGVLVIIGLARTTRPKDAAIHLLGAAQRRWLSRRHGYWEHTAPTVWPPPHSYVEIRRAASELLPGVRWRQLLMW